ncbi:mitochondrial inner membrane protease subunit 2 [Holotrichia oblita]|uniref:Mitochondrial inner membrane protease subunit 2 n=1 Tax=Holotrichia oblita TaxID=644536 RepID=A0ACB9TYV5_HOLOL|nr:mitochondrial inner membrane protease subunit 2 [Holotrichia oblita]
MLDKMAGEEQATIDFNEILLGTQRKYDIIQAKWSEDKNFEIRFRTQIPRHSQDFNALCDEWVDVFSEVTNTVWVKKISNTGPKIKFRKQYQCWTSGGKTVQKELLFDARRCRATLDMKVLTDNPQTRKKNKHIKLGLNVVVKVNKFQSSSRNGSDAKIRILRPRMRTATEPLKPIVYPNDKLPDLVAKMVQRDWILPQKQPPTPYHKYNLYNPHHFYIIDPAQRSHLHQQQLHHQQEAANNDSLQNSTLTPPPGNALEVHNLDATDIQINQLVPLQNVDGIKLEVPQFQQVTQVLVSEADIGEPILFCQPTIMLDPSQVIPVSTHSFAPHFLQLHPQNLANQQGQYL